MWQTKIFSLELFNWERKGITTGGGVNWAPFSMFLKIKISWLNPVLFPWGDNLSCHNAAFKSTELHIWMVKTGKKIWTWRSSSHHSFCFNPSLQFPIPSSKEMCRSTSICHLWLLFQSCHRHNVRRDKNGHCPLWANPLPLNGWKADNCRLITDKCAKMRLATFWWQRCVKFDDKGA